MYVILSIHVLLSENISFYVFNRITARGGKSKGFNPLCFYLIILLLNGLYQYSECTFGQFCRSVGEVLLIFFLQMLSLLSLL